MEKISDKLYNWASILEWNTQEQARKASVMPFIFPHVAIMPDAHLGKGACVGMVLPTMGAIIPAAVGVDIGCGMATVRTQFTSESIQGMDLSVLREMIEKAVPLSAGNYNGEWWGNKATRDRIAELEALDGADQAEKVSPNWRLQLGSLGSGNHFIEVSLDEQDRVWLFLHSGSRGVGNRLAQGHIKTAQQLCEKKKITLPDRDLAYLEESDPEFWDYIRDLRWAQHFALLNRDEMMDRVVSCFEAWAGRVIEQQEVIRCHHNYTEIMPEGMQEFYLYQDNADIPARFSGQHIWLSRKGAIDASEGVMGLIPGSMGDASYIVEGKGNIMSMNSSPHGAGRNYSRSKAKARFTVEELEESMKGIEWNREKGTAFLDEISGAYKPIGTIMEDAADLVSIRHELHQIVNVKGD